MISGRELQIGTDGSGAPVVWSQQGNEPDWHAPICLLLHGYNVDPQGAVAAYDRLFQTIRHKALLPALLDSRSWIVYWPGYASGGLASGKTLMSPLTYASQIPSARDAAHALRHFIEQRCPSEVRPEITIVAHSLGCRVALEFLDSYETLPTDNRPDFPLVVLMAAAVPIHFFEDLVRLWRGALLPSRRLVLYSKSDWILAGPFRVGQTWAGEGVFPKAVGATGRPSGGFWSRVICTRNGHSGYFEDAKTAAEIAGSLGQAPPKDLLVRCEGEAPRKPSRLLPIMRLPSRVPNGQRQ